MSDIKHTHVAGPAIAHIVDTMVKTIGGKDFAAVVKDLPDASIAYLCEYGFAQSMGDTKALSALEKAKAAEKAGVLPEGFTKDLTTQNAAKAVADAIATGVVTQADFSAWEDGFLADRAATRHAAILAGDMVFGSSERLSPEEKDRRAIILERIKQAFADAGKAAKMPKGEELQSMVDWVYQEQKAEIDKEVSDMAKRRAKRPALDLTKFVKA